MRLPLALLATAVSPLLTGCLSPQVDKLVPYEAAVKTPPPADVRCLEGETVDVDALPSLVPFAVMVINLESAQREWPEVRLSKFAVEEVHPDVILLYLGAPAYAGSIGTASAVPVGMGAVAFGFSTPVYQRPLSAICYRLATAKLGVRWDETGMIVTATDEAKAAGLLEGDRIVSINGTPVEIGARALRSGHHSRFLEISPGAEVQVIWIRPGTGRMEGKVVAQENPPVHLKLKGIDLNRPSPYANERP